MERYCRSEASSPRRKVVAVELSVPPVVLSSESPGSSHRRSRWSIRSACRSSVHRNRCHSARRRCGSHRAGRDRDRRGGAVGVIAGVDGGGTGEQGKGAGGAAVVRQRAQPGSALETGVPQPELFSIRLLVLVPIATSALQSVPPAVFARMEFLGSASR